MKQISNRKYEKCQQYLTYQPHGRILTPNVLRIICASADCDPGQIGRHMPEMPAKSRSEKIVE